MVCILLILSKFAGEIARFLNNFLTVEKGKETGREGNWKEREGDTRINMAAWFGSGFLGLILRVLGDESRTLVLLALVVVLGKQTCVSPPVKDNEGNLYGALK